MTSRGAQAGFAEFDRPFAGDRLFLAMLPDAEAAARIAALAASECARHGLRGRPLRTDHLHVTLFHLGDWHGVPADVVAATERAAETLREAPFELAFDEVASFPTRNARKPFVLRASAGNEELRGFRARLAEAFGRNGLAKWARDDFEPHVTLAYDDTVVPARRVETLAWTAREFVLVHSLVGRGKHTPVARWRLGA